MIVNQNSNHTLLAPYQMCELRMVIDDVSARHLKSSTEFGTSTITTPNGEVIDLKTRAA